MPTITEIPKGTTVIQAKTKTKAPADLKGAWQWWNSNDKGELADKLISTVQFIKENQTYRFRQASMYAALYGNLPLAGWIGTSYTKMVPQAMPTQAPTMSVVTSCVDTVVAKLSVKDPRPVFLTDGADYRYRDLSKQMTQFIKGLFYQCDAYESGKLALRDACVLGTGVVKILEGPDKKVELERRLIPELFVDNNDAFYGKPRCFYEVKLVDRAVLMANHPKEKKLIGMAESGYPDQSGNSAQTVSDMIIVIEAWRLRSSAQARDGLHVMVCSDGPIDEEEYDKDYFPFSMLHYAPRLYGLWGQGIAERQMGTQMEISKLLTTISRSINLVGVPRIFLEQGSKVSPAAFDNQIGSIVKYHGIKPTYEVAPCVPNEMYGQLARLIQFAYQQEGVSELTAQAEKPPGLDSGEAIRSYNNIQAVRFSTIEKRYNDFYIDLAYKSIDLAKAIAERDGKYSVIYPGKEGISEIDLPAAKLLSNVYEIQCYEESSLPDDPAGRLATVTEWADRGWVDAQEAKRLLNFPDLDENTKLEQAGKERILKILDQIIISGDFTPPDSFMDYQLALKLVVQYYNFYIEKKLEERKAQLLRDFYAQVQGMIKAATAPPMPAPGVAQGLPPPQPQLAAPPAQAMPTPGTQPSPGPMNANLV